MFILYVYTSLSDEKIRKMLISKIKRKCQVNTNRNAVVIVHTYIKFHIVFIQFRNKKNLEKPRH